MPQQLSEFLRAQVEQRGISERELSRRAGLGTTTIHFIINRPKSTPTYDTCVRLATALELPPEILLQLAGYEKITLDAELDKSVLTLAIYLDGLSPELRSYALEACWAITRILVRASETED